jgi:hypothetical protein
MAHNDDLDLRQGLAQPTRCFQAIHAGHMNVEKNKIRKKLAGLFQGIGTVGRFGANFAASVAGHNSGHSAPNQLAIIRNQNSHKTAMSLTLLL